MRPNEVPFEHAFAMERALRTYMAAQGVPTIPCNEFSGRSAEHQQAPTTYLLNERTGRVERMVLPDLIRFPNFLALEIKTQGYAPMFRKAGVRTTGFLRRHYDHYRRYERESGKSVEVAFVQLIENRIVGATLAEMEPARTPRVNPGQSDTWYWEYEALPRWSPEPLTAILDLARFHGKKLGREGYSEADHRSVMEYLEKHARPNYDKHEAEWNSEPAARIRIAPVIQSMPRQASLFRNGG